MITSTINHIQNLVVTNILSHEKYESYQKLTIVDCPFSLSEVEVANTVGLVFDRVKRELEYGKSNVIIINNFSELLKIFNAAVEGYYDFSKFSAKAMNKITNLLYLAKNVNEKLNVTIICADNNPTDSEVSMVLKSECLGLFNKVYEQLN